MSNIFLTSDTHFGHDKEFVYEARGFKSIGEHDEILVENFNKMVKRGDEVYHLGDVCLGDDKKSIEYLKRLHGNIHIILGNHDSDRRMELYKKCPNVVDVVFADRIRVGKQVIFLSHALSETYIIGKKLERTMINFFGHTHQEDSPFVDGIPYAYNVGVDCHDNKPVALEQAILDIRKQYGWYRNENPDLFEKYSKKKSNE